MRVFRRTLAACLLLMLCFLSTAQALTPETNSEYQPELYPYVVHTDSANWYISQADIDLMGLDDILSNLEAILVNQEADFADARNALSGFVKEVPPVTICTDFSGHAEISQRSSAYYNGVSNFIKVFHDWKHCAAALMHEYVHYMTFACTETPITPGFWAEGVAEYVSRIVCKNRMSRSVDMGSTDEEIAFFREKGAWDPEENCVDEKLLYFAIAELYHRGIVIGESYFAVSNDIIERTEKIQLAPKPDQLSMQEAASMVAYLVETFGKDTVFSAWSTDPENMEPTFGQSFQELYAAWKEWNTLQFEQAGMVI